MLGEADPPYAQGSLRGLKFLDKAVVAINSYK